MEMDEQDTEKINARAARFAKDNSKILFYNLLPCQIIFQFKALITALTNVSFLLQHLRLKNL